MKIIVENQSDLDKYLVDEKSEHWIACMDRAIKGPAFEGPMYYLPAHAELLICTRVEGVNLFTAGGAIKCEEGAGSVHDSLIYNRLIEEF